MSDATYYKRPDWFSAHVMGPALKLPMRFGISVLGSRILEHRGRRSGTVYHVPVNLLHHEGSDYLVSPRGTTEWVRNVRAADGQLVLILGRRRQQRRAVEVPAAEREPILREYLRRWKFEVGMFFEGVGPDSPSADFQAIAERHPVFRLT